jgi:hypothetical protein
MSFISFLILQIPNMLLGDEHIQSIVIGYVIQRKFQQAEAMSAEALCVH